MAIHWPFSSAKRERQELLAQAEANMARLGRAIERIDRGSRLEVIRGELQDATDDALAALNRLTPPPAAKKQ